MQALEHDRALRVNPKLGSFRQMDQNSVLYKQFRSFCQAEMWFPQALRIVGLFPTKNMRNSNMLDLIYAS
jgi:hypothetical protein